MVGHLGVFSRADLLEKGFSVLSGGYGLAPPLNSQLLTTKVGGTFRGTYSNVSGLDKNLLVTEP
jgi:hypothetical protein